MQLHNICVLIVFCFSGEFVNSAKIENITDASSISLDGWLSKSANCADTTFRNLTKESPIVSISNSATSDCELSFSFDVDENIDLEEGEIGVELTFEILSSQKTANIKCPILFAIFEEEQITTLKLPYISNTNTNSNSSTVYFKTGRTLCKSQAVEKDLTERNQIIVRASTCSKEEIKFTLVAQLVSTSLREYSENGTELVVGPSAPKHLVYKRSLEDSIIVHTQSSSDICMTVSVQNLYCPLFEQENNVKYTGHHKTMTTQSVMEIERTDFPDGFHIVFVVHQDDKECSTFANKNYTLSKDKSIIVQLMHPKKTNGFYSFLHVLIPVSISVIVGILVFLAYVCHENYLTRNSHELAPSNRRGSTVVTDGRTSSVFLSDFSVTVTETDGYLPVNLGDGDSITTSAKSTVISGMANCHRNHNPYHFVGILIFISLFYAIPVYELAINFLMTLKGNYDRCFFNELCVHRLGGLVDFNHFWSNTSYFLFGVIFCCIAYKRGQSPLFNNVNNDKGIPYQKEMFYSLGVALAMEGVFSAAYHLCPNQFTFQYDTTYMYVIASLTLIKLFLSRHPVTYFTAYKIYGILVVLVLITAFSYLLDTASDYKSLKHIYILYAIGQSAGIVLLSIYYCDVGLIKDNSGNTIVSPLKIVQKRLKNIYYREENVEPFLLKRAFVPVIILITSIIIFSVLTNLSKGFASLLLFTMVSITIICVGSYIFWKLWHGEFREKKKMLFVFPGLCFLLCGLLGLLSLYFFFKTPYDPDDSPAISRSKNIECTLSIYDNHDWWHMISSISLFLGYMALLTMDDGLVTTLHQHIHVF